SSASSESRRGNDLRKFRNFRKNVLQSAAVVPTSAKRRTTTNAPGVEETMHDRMGTWRRRRVLGGLLASTTALAAPSVLRAAPSGAPVKVGGTLSLTGFLAQTAVIHKISAEMMVEEINGRNGFLGRPVEYVLLDDQSKPDVARSLYEKLITVDQ